LNFYFLKKLAKASAKSIGKKHRPICFLPMLLPNFEENRSSKPWTISKVTFLVSALADIGQC